MLIDDPAKVFLAGELFLVLAGVCPVSVSFFIEDVPLIETLEAGDVPKEFTVVGEIFGCGLGGTHGLKFLKFVNYSWLAIKLQIVN